MTNVIEQLDCIKRKDKQIDLMAKYIDKIDVSEIFEYNYYKVNKEIE